MKNWKYINGAEIGNANPGQKVKVDFNWIGVTPRVEEVKVIRKRPAMAGRGDPNPGYEIEVELPNGKTYWVHENAVVGNETMHEWATSKPRNIGNATIKYYGETIDLTKMPEHELLEILEELQMLHEYTDGQRAIKEELKRRQIGNAKVINSDREFFKELADDAKEREDKDKQEVEKLVENRLEKEYGVKAKNEASDDKFAYVMREFDEGKLKTPNGKVVTDPAQAKAIAYSESKKTENGLARARNAIKK